MKNVTLINYAQVKVRLGVYKTSGAIACLLDSVIIHNEAASVD